MCCCFTVYWDIMRLVNVFRMDSNNFNIYSSSELIFCSGVLYDVDTECAYWLFGGKYCRGFAVYVNIMRLGYVYRIGSNILNIYCWSGLIHCSDVYTASAYWWSVENTAVVYCLLKHNFRIDSNILNIYCWSGLIIYSNADNICPY